MGMNREIEFRGRSVSDGCWVYGDLEYERDKGLLGKVRIHTYKENGRYDRQYLVESSTVGEFTGMRDKHGKKIFEGDIIRFVGGKKKVNEGWVDNEFIYTVEYSEGAFRGILGLSKALDAVEVIGNIHDNPELLATK